jgi:hypothetical protein
VNSVPTKIGISDKVTQKKRPGTMQRIGDTLNVGSALSGLLYRAEITQQKNPKAM